MIPPHTKAIPLNRLPVVRKHGEALFLPRRRRDNEIPVKSGRRSCPLCPARRPMPAEPDAALPPRSAPRSEHAARYEGSVFEMPRAAADRDAATPRPNCPGPSAARAKERAALRKMLRPAHPHRTRHPGHFSGQRKVSVLMRTTWGGPGFASARRGRAALFPALPGQPPDAGRGSRGGKTGPRLRRRLPSSAGWNLRQNLLQ